MLRVPKCSLDNVLAKGQCNEHFFCLLAFGVRLCMEKMSDDVFKCSSETASH